MNYIDPRIESVLNRLSKKHTVRIERDPMTMQYIFSLNGAQHRFNDMKEIEAFISSIICEEEKETKMSKKTFHKAHVDQKEGSKFYTEVFVAVNEDGTGGHVPMDNAQVEVFSKRDNIYINEETNEVVIVYVFKRETRHIRIMSDGWEHIKIKKDTHG